MSTDFHQAGASAAFLGQKLDLAGVHSPETQYFRMESRLAMKGPTGATTSTDIYRLHLRCKPLGAAAADAEELTCLRFTAQLGSAPETAIPSLSGWTYIFRHVGADEKGQTLGIDHQKFESLVDANGDAVPPGNAYHVYNAFIDFHSFCWFSERSRSGKGIQHLSRVGQRIIHAASYSAPSTGLGSMFAEGSHFRNGEVTLELKGIGLAGEKPCAIIGYDSGASSFTMIMNPAPSVEARTEGSSHYWGDIFKSLDTGWIQRATLHELVVSETNIPAVSKKLNAVVERSIEVRNVPEP